jgi:hypothetical protein
MAELGPVCLLPVDTFVGGAGTLPALAVWVLGYLGPLYTGLEPCTLDGRLNPRAQGRAPDDCRHWYAADGCGRWDRAAFGREVVAARRAYRRASEAMPCLRRSAEARRAARRRFLDLTILCSCACGLALSALLRSSLPHLWDAHSHLCAGACFLYAPQIGAVLASAVEPLTERVRAWMWPISR